MKQHTEASAGQAGPSKASTGTQTRQQYMTRYHQQYMTRYNQQYKTRYNQQYKIQATTQDKVQATIHDKIQSIQDKIPSTIQDTINNTTQDTSNNTWQDTSNTGQDTNNNTWQDIINNTRQNTINNIQDTINNTRQDTINKQIELFIDWSLLHSVIHCSRADVFSVHAGLSESFHNPPNSEMDYRTLNVRAWSFSMGVHMGDPGRQSHPKDFLKRSTAAAVVPKHEDSS